MQIGATLKDRYELLSELKRGDTGVTFLAADKVLGDRPVLVLEMSASGSHGEAREACLRSFRAEARRLTQLHHPNVGKVNDWFEEDERVHLVTSIPRGETLLSVLTRRRITMQEAAAWIDQVAAALEHLHAQQPPVHMRLLDPANVMIDDGARAVISGFDLSHTLQSGQYVNRPGMGTGDSAYSAPEVRGGGAVDARADVYALGALMYFTFTGRRPPVDTEGRAATTPRVAYTAIPPQLEGLIVKAMALEKAERYADMRELRRALHQVRQQTDLRPPVGGAADRQLPSQPVTPSEAEVVTPLPGPVSMRNPRVFTDEAIQAEMDKPLPRRAGGGGMATLAIVLLMAIVFGGGGTWWYKSHVPKDAPVAQSTNSPGVQEASDPEAGNGSSDTQMRPGQGLTGLRVTSVPPGARVTIDNKPAQANTDIKLPPGEHRVRVEAEGYLSYSKAFKVVNGQINEVRPTLAPTNQAAVQRPQTPLRGPRTVDVPVAGAPPAASHPTPAPATTGREPEQPQEVVPPPRTIPTPIPTAQAPPVKTTTTPVPTPTLTPTPTPNPPTPTPTATGNPLDAKIDPNGPKGYGH